MNKKAFYLVVKDEDKKIFNLVGPMTDDSVWNERASVARSAGRQVTCFSTISSSPETLELLEFAKRTGFKYSSNSILA